MGFTGHPLALSAPGRSLSRPTQLSRIRDHWAFASVCSISSWIRSPYRTSTAATYRTQRSGLPNATTLSCGPAVSWFSGRESCGSVVTPPSILVQTHRRIRGTPRIFLFDHSAPSGDVKNSQRGSPPFRGCFLNIYGKMFGLHEPALSSVKQPVGRAGTIPEHFSRSLFFTQALGGLLPFLVTAFRALLAPKSCWRLSAVHI